MRTVNPEQHARKRAEILQAAAVEFAAYGLDGATTARIRKRAGIGSGTLFHYFPTKRALFHAMVAESLADNAAACEQALLDANADQGLERLIAHLTRDLDDASVPGLAAATLLQANRDPEFATMLAVDEERTLTTLTSLLARMAHDGRRLAFGPRRVARWIVTTIDATLLATGGDDFHPVAHNAELRQLVGWLTGE